MFTRTRNVTLLMVLTALCLPLLGAADGAAAATGPDHVAGFFETHYWLIEIVFVALLAFIVVGGMASNTTTQAIETTHWDYWWPTPRGRSYTHIPVPVEPASPATIKRTLLILGAIYVLLRLTCLSGCFSMIFQGIGSLIDLFLR